MPLRLREGEEEEVVVVVDVDIDVDGGGIAKLLRFVFAFSSPSPCFFFLRCTGDARDKSSCEGEQRRWFERDRFFSSESADRKKEELVLSVFFVRR